MVSNYIDPEIWDRIIVEMAISKLNIVEKKSDSNNVTGVVNPGALVVET